MTGQSRSLKRQLAISLSLGITALWLLTITAVALTVMHELEEVFDSNLEQTAGRILPLAVQETAPDPGNTGLPKPVAADDEELNYVIRDAQGAVLMMSRNAGAVKFDGNLTEGFRDTETQRIYHHNDAVSGYSITVAEPLAHRREAALGTIGALVLPVFILVPLCLMLVFWIVHRALRPLDRLRLELSERGSADLRPVGETGLPPEVTTIAQAVNQLLERLTRTLEAERSFTANAAHEMRTPIAAALAQSQRLLAELSETPTAERARLVETELRRLSRLSEKLMQLARAEGGSLVAPPQDMVPILQAVVDDFRRAGHDARLNLTVPASGTATLALDADAFGILVRNLIENALRHGDADGMVQISLHADGRLRVTNSGPAVDPNALALLTKRFTRGTAKAEGSGLGLAIADTIARACGASLNLSSPIPGRADGFQAELVPSQS